jgi:putative hemolysin
METHMRFPNEEAGAYHTLAGFMLYQLGYIPKVAETAEWGEYRFEVLDMDGNRIDKLLVTHVPPAREAQDEDELRDDAA